MPGWPPPFVLAVADLDGQYALNGRGLEAFGYTAQGTIGTETLVSSPLQEAMKHA
jgi:hypothetical protein